MRILVFTFHRAHNFGAVLQAFALQWFLEDKGFSVSFANIKHVYIDKLYSPFVTKYQLSAYGDVKNRVRYIFGATLLFPVLMVRYIIFKRFISQNINQFPKKTVSEKQFDRIIDQFDAYIAGSDQIWNKEVTIEYDKQYFLAFPSKAPRVIYAASIGDEKQVINNQSIILDYLSFGQFVSTRESYVTRILGDLGIKSTHVIDPVFLLPKEIWNKFTRPIHKLPYIFVYIFGDNPMLYEFAEKLAEEKKLRIIEVKLGFKKKIKSQQPKFTSPFKFLSLIENAEYIVTNSFHATAFSIIFHKPFFVFDSGKTSKRMVDLLNTFDLKDRYLQDLSQTDNSPIDYCKVQSKIDTFRHKSINYLLSNLPEIEG